MTTTTAPTAPTLADLTDEELGQLAQLVATDGRQFLGADVVTAESIASEAQERAETRARESAEVFAAAAQAGAEAMDLAAAIVASPEEALAAHEDEGFTQFHESEIELAPEELGLTDAEILAEQMAAEHAVVDNDAAAEAARWESEGGALVLASDHARYEAEAAALVAEATAITAEAAPKKRAKKAVCSGSSTYVAHTEEDIVERTAKGRAAYAEVECPSCNVRMRAGVWFSEKGIQLRGDEGMTYLSKHTV